MLVDPHQALREESTKTPSFLPSVDIHIYIPNIWHLIGGEKYLLNACMS